MAGKYKTYNKSDGTQTVADEKGKIIDNVASLQTVKANLQANSKIASEIEAASDVEDNRTAKEITKDLKEANKEADFAGNVLELSLDAVTVLDNKIEELEDERLTARLAADAENRPLDEEGIARAKEIGESINELRRRKRELISRSKDARLIKAEADVAAYENEVALEAASGKVIIHDYEGETLGDAVITGEFEANSPEWHEQRRNVIGGSDISAIMGTSVFTNASSLLATKLGIIDPSFEKTVATSLGDIYEPIIQREFAKRHPEYTLYHSKASWRNKDRSTHGANVDGIYDSTGKGGAPDSILEIKAVSRPWTNGVPSYYRSQILWYMSVTGFRKGTVACLTNQSEYNEYEIIPEPGEIEAIVAEVKLFEAKIKKEAKKLERMKEQNKL